MSVMLQLILILLFMIASAFFSGIETGIISINRIRLSHFVRKKKPGADLLMSFLENPHRLLGATLVGNNIAAVACSILSASLAIKLFGSAGKFASTIIMSILLLVFCEFLPKAWFQSQPIWRCIPFAKLFQIVERILRPLAFSTTWISSVLVPAPGHKNQHHITREEIKAVIDEEALHGIISQEEHKMILRTIDLSSMQVKEIMRNISETAVLDDTMSLSQMLEIVAKNDYTRFPYKKTEDNTIKGFIDIGVLLSLNEDADKTNIENLVQPLHQIYETALVTEILTLAKTTRQRIFLVISESTNEITGLVTVGDVFRKILAGP